MKLCNLLKEDMYTALPGANTFLDARHADNHQVADGNLSLLPNSCPYHMLSDRILCAREHLRFMGWGDEVDLSCVVASKPLRKKAPKRARPSKASGSAVDTKIKRIAGNGLVVPDFATIAVPLAMCLFREDLWDSPLRLGDLDFDDSTASSASKFVNVDANAPVHILKGLVGANEDSGGDEDSENGDTGEGGGSGSE